MKIVCILASLSQPRCIKRVKALQTGGHEVVVYGFYRGYYDVNKYPSSIKVCSWGNIESGSKYLPRFYTIFRNLRKCFHDYQNEDVLYYCFSFESALVMSLFKHKKFVYEISDLIYCYFKNFFLKRLFRRIDKFVINKSYKTILTSGGFYEYLYGSEAQETDDSKFIIQPNKLSTYFLDTPRTVLSIDKESGLRFAYIGAFRYPDTIFRFARIIGERFPNHTFSFYGDSSLTYLSKDLAEKYENIHYLGKFKNPEDLASIYENVDVVVACYDIKEGENEQVAEPNKLYESICFCKPIIVSKHTYLSKRVEELNVGYSISADNDKEIIDFVANIDVADLHKKSQVSYNLPYSEFIDSSSLLLASL